MASKALGPTHSHERNRPQAGVTLNDAPGQQPAHERLQQDQDENYAPRLPWIRRPYFSAFYAAAALGSAFITSSGFLNLGAPASAVLSAVSCVASIAAFRASTTKIKAFSLPAMTASMPLLTAGYLTNSPWAITAGLLAAGTAWTATAISCSKTTAQEIDSHRLNILLKSLQETGPARLWIRKNTEAEKINGLIIKVNRYILLLTPTSDKKPCSISQNELHQIGADGQAVIFPIKLRPNKIRSTSQKVSATVRTKANQLRPKAGKINRPALNQEISQLNSRELLTLISVLAQADISPKMQTELALEKPSPSNFVPDTKTDHSWTDEIESELASQDGADTYANSRNEPLQPMWWRPHTDIPNSDRIPPGSMVTLVSESGLHQNWQIMGHSFIYNGVLLVDVANPEEPASPAIPWPLASILEATNEQ